jgi:hypothetical protein
MRWWTVGEAAVLRDSMVVESGSGARRSAVRCATLRLYEGEWSSIQQSQRLQKIVARG